jgi:hypothetical protein
MIIGITKEDGDRMLTDFLVKIAKIDGTKECAEESFQIMDDFNDSQLIVSIIVADAFKQKGHIPEKIGVFQNNILSALATMFVTCDKEEVPKEFGDLFLGSDEEVLEKVNLNKKINFAVEQFVSAFYHFETFEKKYPVISKLL